ncbi:uncharacterized protein N7496_010551 [Penicillium cataractarum]|uniref:Rhodopsin domain-containing protein n=1 Tax=Penicillium cataractarum TaxID=2100454 RepID=A0A9W9V100_9EURO|nr:uncharacterized protein N7496_010551 [Penicillium cataractarum]KAJ5364838.1 hypothetical protein N7496_010551 [Penicillium cataractarum]
MENLMNTSITAVLGPPPANVDLRQNRTWRDNAAVITISVIAVIAVAIRFIVRLQSQKPRPFLDEWLIAATLVPMLALLAASLAGGHYGMGKHVWLVTIGAMVKMKKILFTYLFVYLFELFLIKISILAFYRRIFGRNWSIWICLFLTTGWTVGSMIALLVSSDPVAYFWTSTYNSKGGHYRYNFYNYYIGNAAANVVIDVLILLIPVPVVWRLKLRVTQKIMITSVFFMGVFVCIASIVRLHYLTYLKGTLDITWVMSNVYVWSTVEPCLGIICACLPALQPLIQSFMKAEHLLYLRKRIRHSKKMSQVNRLREHISNTSSSDNSHSRSDTMDSFDGKPELGLRAHDDEVHLTSCVAQAESDRCRKERENLEEFLGPMFIRVEHEVEWTVDRS